MRPRSFALTLLALVAVFLASHFSLENRDLLTEPFRLGAGIQVPLYFAVLVIFLLGFLPLITQRLIESLRRDLARRKERRDSRAADSLELTFHRAVDLERDGQLERAAREFEVVLATLPDNYSALQRYGGVLRAQGRSDEAVATHQRAAAAHPRSVAMLYELIDDYAASGQRAVAEEIRNRILRDFPDRGVAVLRQRLRDAVADADWPAATALHEKLEASEGAVRDPELERGLAYQRGVQLLEDDRARDAAEVFHGLLAEAPEFLPAWVMLGEARLVEERWDDAVDLWRAGYQATHSPVLLQRIEDHFIEREQPERAIEAVRRLIADAPEDPLPRFFLGRLYYRIEMLDEAYKSLVAVADRFRSAPTFHFLIGRIHERRGEIRLAAEAYRCCGRELGVQRSEFSCSRCQRRFSEWHDRCVGCGAWGTVELAVDPVEPPALDRRLVEAPVWSAGGYDGV